eukprot:TRINITY_DN13933_c0_g1_i1.p1 TRINITY_DN13933_c0_g1~~TRINITY_DN13933_c0_g1_i1.p1  ORF type:complete len:164 (-),score=33.49 TRINITY_DN13933_c0_g1_i1:168-659(-)
MQRGLVGSEMCIRDRYQRRVHGATYTIETKSITFLVILDGKCLGSKEMSLTQLPKSLQNKEIVDMIFLSNDDQQGELSLILMFEAGDILKIFVNQEELEDVDELPLNLTEFPSSSILTMVITLLLVMIPLFLGLRISLNRGGLGNLFRQRVNPQPGPQAGVQH